MQEFEFGLAGQILLGSMLFFIMFAVGTSLEWESFLKSLKHPRAYLIGLACQYLMMPLLAVVLSKIFSLTPEVFLVLLIIGCSPGGTSSNMFTFLVKGDVSLSVALTLTSSLLALVMTPFLISLYADQSGYQELVIPFKNIIFTLLAALLPVALGMLLRIFKIEWALMAEKIARQLGMGIVFIMILIWIPKLVRFLSADVASIFLAIALMSLLGIVFGMGVSRLLQAKRPQALAVGFETGIQNAPLAFAIIGLSFASTHPIQSVAWVALVYGALSVGNAIMVMLWLRFFRSGSHRA